MGAAKDAIFLAQIAPSGAMTHSRNNFKIEQASAEYRLFTPLKTARISGLKS